MLLSDRDIKAEVDAGRIGLSRRALMFVSTDISGSLRTTAIPISILRPISLS